MRKTVLDIDSNQANKYFLNLDAYITTDLPTYYNFEFLLSLLSKKLNGKSIDKNQIEAAKKAENVNHIIYGNKNGKYEWRKLELVHPLLYISLINLITNKDSWNIICERFRELRRNKSIRCVSMPVLPDPDQKQKASQVIEWIELVEKESIRLALDFEYLFQTDIADCYGSIYTHSVAWAIHGRPLAKEKRRYEDLLGNKIDHHLQAMSYGQTNGVPLGSQIMDFIAEMVLAHADQELSRKISKNIKIDEYHILRYRDDYRIFVRTPYAGEIIMKALSETLADLGLSLNTRKTTKSEKIVIDSIKPEKIVSLHQPILKVLNQYSLRNELLMIYELGTKFPNNGLINKRLTKIIEIADDRILRIHYKEIVSILTNIAYENPNSFPVAAALISKAIVKLNHKDKKSILDRIFRKVRLLPNSGILEIWLQRITIAHNIKYPYEEKLCVITGGKNVPLFNSSWINTIAIKQLIDSTQIVNRGKIANLDKTINKKEIELFKSLY